VIKRYLIPCIGAIPLVKLTPQHAQAIYAEMLGKGLSQQTVIHAHRVLRGALDHAVKWGVLARNVCDAVDPPRARRKEMSTLDASDVQKLLDAAAGSPYGQVFFLALYTGMRRSELMGLRWSAVDLEHKTISVTQTIIRLSGKGLKVMEPKTAKSRRLISLPPSAVALLGGLRAKQREERNSLGLDWSESDYVFSRSDRSLIDPDTITHAFADIVNKAGLPHVRLHDLRHTHATLMLKQGVHPKIVSERLGHASITITLDTYSHVLPGLQEAAALDFEEALRQDGVKEKQRS
jgi:integrase